MKLNSMTYVCLSVAFLASATEGDTIRGASSTIKDSSTIRDSSTTRASSTTRNTFNITNYDKLVGDSGVDGGKDDKSTDGVENEDGDDEKELSKLPTPTPSALPTTSSNGTSTT